MPIELKRDDATLFAKIIEANFRQVSASPKVKQVRDAEPVTQRITRSKMQNIYVIEFYKMIDTVPFRASRREGHDPDVFRVAKRQVYLCPCLPCGYLSSGLW